MVMLLATLSFAAPGDAGYGEGIAALKAKDGPAAEAALALCHQEAPERLDCLWELGWAHWLQNDWAGVVEVWQQVDAAEPGRAELTTYLPQAQRNLALQQELAASSAEAPATFVSAAPDGATLRLRAVGDMMLGTTFPAGYLPADDGQGLLDGMAGWMADADLTFANVEGPLCDEGVSRKCAPDSTNCYAFKSPTRYGQYFADAGVDLASLANNHSGDFGEACRRASETTLDELGIAWSGPPGSIATAEANGLKVAMIAFHSSTECNYINDHATAKALVAKADATHDIVIVSFHGGAEGSKALHVPDEMELFYGEQRGHLRVFTHEVVDAGADLVLGHGPHVPRAIEVYEGRLIAYSLGNFATYGRFNLSGHLGTGFVLETTMDAEGRFAGGRILSTKQEGRGVPVQDPTHAAADLVRKLSTEDFPATGVRVAADGSLAAP